MAAPSDAKPYPTKTKGPPTKNDTEPKMNALTENKLMIPDAFKFL